MAIAVPTGIKIFNWLFTLWKGKNYGDYTYALFTSILTDFTIGGVTGVMLGMSAADYQYHNTMFLVATFPYGYHSWCGIRDACRTYLLLAKNVFGFMLNERIGKWAASIIGISTLVAFMPMFFL